MTRHTRPPAIRVIWAARRPAKEGEPARQATQPSQSPPLRSCPATYSGRSAGFASRRGRKILVRSLAERAEHSPGIETLCLLNDTPCSRVIVGRHWSETPLAGARQVGERSRPPSIRRSARRTGREIMPGEVSNVPGGRMRLRGSEREQGLAATEHEAVQADPVPAGGIRPCPIGAIVATHWIAHRTGPARTSQTCRTRFGTDS